MSLERGEICLSNFALKPVPCVVHHFYLLYTDIGPVETLQLIYCDPKGTEQSIIPYSIKTNFISH